MQALICVEFDKNVWVENFNEKYLSQQSWAIFVEMERISGADIAISAIESMTKILCLGVRSNLPVYVRSITHPSSIAITHVKLLKWICFCDNTEGSYVCA